MDLSEFYDYDLFQGNDAQIIAKRKYNEIFTCEFQLKMYPFDSQICSMTFRLVQHQVKSVRLSTKCPWEIPLDQEINVGEFRVTKIEGTTYNDRKRIWHPYQISTIEMGVL